jgi:hypothetical protein
MSILGAIADFATGVYTVTRRTAGTRVGGRWTAGASTGFPVQLCVQPPTGRELRDLPEGARGDDVRVVYTATELLLRDEITLEDGDQYAVIRAERWDLTGAVHWRCWIARVDKP